MRKSKKSSDVFSDLKVSGQENKEIERLRKEIFAMYNAYKSGILLEEGFKERCDNLQKQVTSLENIQKAEVLMQDPSFKLDKEIKDFLREVIKLLRSKDSKIDKPRLAKAIEALDVDVSNAKRQKRSLSTEEAQKFLELRAESEKAPKSQLGPSTSKS